MRVLLRAYDPDQERDEDGKWTGGSGWKESEGQVTVYHGTTRKVLESIARTGLQFKGQARSWGAPRHGSGTLYDGDRGKAVFVSSSRNAALWYARQRVWNQGRGKAAVLTLSIPRQEMEKFRTDADSKHDRHGKAAYTTRRIKPSWIVRAQTYEGFGELKDVKLKRAETDLIEGFVVLDLIDVNADKVLLRAYDPEQVRDEGGRWTAGAYGPGGKYGADRERVFAAPRLSFNSLGVFGDRFEEVFGGRYSRKYANAKDALSRHQNSTHHLDDKKVRKAMDRAFKYAAVELKSDAVVYRGMHASPDLIKKLESAKDRSGRVYLQQSKTRYVPATTEKGVASSFGSVRLRIFLPKGTRVLAPAMVTGKFGGEREVTLNRGARFRVVGGANPNEPFGSGKTTLTVAYVGAVHNKKSHLTSKIDLRRVLKVEQTRDEHFTGDLEYVEIDGEVVYGERPDESDTVDGDEALKREVVDLRKYFAAPTSATSGPQGYDLEGNRASRAGVRLRPKRQRLLLRSPRGRIQLIPTGGQS